MKKLKIITVILIISLISCDKEEFYEIDSEFKRYFCSYRDGSWWLLKDPINLESDSLYILDYAKKRESPGPRSKEYYEIIEYKLYSKGKTSWAFCGVEKLIGFTVYSLQFTVYSIQKQK